MTANGLRVELECLYDAVRELRELSDEVRQDTREPLALSGDQPAGFASAQAVIAAADAWEVEAAELTMMLRTAGDKLAASVAEYDRADVRTAHHIHRILRGG